MSNSEESEKHVENTFASNDEANITNTSLASHKILNKIFDIWTHMAQEKIWYNIVVRLNKILIGVLIVLSIYMYVPLGFINNTFLLTTAAVFSLFIHLINYDLLNHNSEARSYMLILSGLGIFYLSLFILSPLTWTNQLKNYILILCIVLGISIWLVLIANVLILGFHKETKILFPKNAKLYKTKSRASEMRIAVVGPIIIISFLGALI